MSRYAFDVSSGELREYELQHDPWLDPKGDHEEQAGYWDLKDPVACFQFLSHVGPFLPHLDEPVPVLRRIRLTLVGELQRIDGELVRFGEDPAWCTALDAAAVVARQRKVCEATVNYLARRKRRGRHDA